MPFQSEKQRRYLWANEPKIARYWTDTYGSGIARALGGRIPFASGSIFNKLSLSQLKEKLKETSQDAPEYSDIQAAIETKQGKTKSDLAKELGMTSWGKPSEEFNKLFEDVRKWKRDENLSYEDVVNPDYGPLKNQDPEVIKKIYNIAKTSGKGTIEFDPNNVQISKAGMLPSWEDLKTLGGNLKYDLQRAAEPGMDIFDTWEGAQGQQLYDKNYRDIEGARSFNVVPTPSEENLMMGDIDAGYGLTPQKGIMQVGTPFVDDYNYPQRQTMARDWSELDDYEAQNLDIPRQQELARLAGMEQYPTTEEEDEDGNWWKNYGQIARSAIANKFGKGWLGSALAGPIGWGASLAGGIGNFANTMRGGLTQRGYEQARDARIKQSRIDYMLDRRAAGDPYSQKNLNLLTMGSRPGFYDSPQTQPKKAPISVPVPAHISGGGAGDRNQPSGGVGSAASRQGPAGGSVGASRFRSHGGRLYNTGGLAGLWPR